jgi:hypothetical protein
MKNEILRSEVENPKSVFEAEAGSLPYFLTSLINPSKFSSESRKNTIHRS